MTHAHALIWCLIGAAICGVPVGYLLAALLIVGRFDDDG